MAEISSAGPRPTCQRATRWLFLGILTIASGCIGRAERHLPALDLHDSHLVTPTGPVLFEMADDWRDPGFAMNQGLMIRAQASDFQVLVGVLTGVQQVFLRNMRRPLTVDVVSGGSWYQLNTESRIPLTLTRAESSGETSGGPVRLDFELPPALARYDIRVHGGTLRPAQVDQIRAAETERHHLHLPFTADGETYVVNVTFRVEVRTYEVPAAPATP